MVNVLQQIWQNLNEVPPIILAAAVLVFGIVIANWIGDLTFVFLSRLKLNQVLKRLGAEDALSRLDTRLNAPKFFGELVKWFFVIFSIMTASDILGLSQLSELLGKAIGYYPNIFVAGFIFMVAAFLADFSSKVVIGSLEKEKITYSRFAGRATNWLIWLFAALAILYQLKITPSLILTIFIGMVATIAITLGIAFGLGGKDLASRILKELEDKFK